MIKIGIIASGSTFTTAFVVLEVEMPKEVHHEDLCLIVNLNSPNGVIAVVRDGKSVDENLNPGRYSPGIGRARHGLNVPSQRKQEMLELDIIGESPEEGTLRQNRTLIAPQSDVFLLEDVDKPMNRLLDKDTKPEFTIGYYRDHPEWRIPVKPIYISYHIGVYGTTGAGKTMLIVYEIIPTLRQAGYHIIIIDWKGKSKEDSYTKFFQENIVKWSDISLDEETIISFLSSQMRDFGYTGDKREKNPVREALADTVYSPEFQSLISPDPSPEGPDSSLALITLEDAIRHRIESDHLNAKREVTSWGRRHLRRFQKYFRKLKAKDLKAISGDKSARDVIEQALSTDMPLVVDLGSLTPNQKRTLFLAIAEQIEDMAEEEQKLGLALVIDEGPQYCPWKPERGVSWDTTKAIQRLCATGRSADLAIVIASQGVAGEVGLNAAVRRNLNTSFIGRIGASDLSTNEVNQLIQSLKLKPDYLLGMEGPGGKRLFYFQGRMSPSTKPLLISFDIEDEAEDETGRS